MQIAQFAAAGQVDGELEVADAPPLGAGLEDAAVAVHRVGQGLAVADGDAAGLLAVDILARLRSQDRCQSMPVIARGDQHGVNVLAGEQLEHITVHTAVLVAVFGIGHGLDLLAPAGLHVADGDEPHVRLVEHATQHVPATGTDADGAQHRLLTGRHSPVFAQSAGWDDGRRRQRQAGRCQELPACQ